MHRIDFPSEQKKHEYLEGLLREVEAQQREAQKARLNPKVKDYLVTVSPGEKWEAIWLVRDAPSASEAEQSVWTERGYNSGEPVRVKPRSTEYHPQCYSFAPCPEWHHIITYSASEVESARELVRYND